MCVFFFLLIISILFVFIFFFFNDTATTEIYTLSLHDALPIFRIACLLRIIRVVPDVVGPGQRRIFRGEGVRSEGTRLNSSHPSISYAVFCLKKKKKKKNHTKL